MKTRVPVLIAAVAVMTAAVWLTWCRNGESGERANSQKKPAVVRNDPRVLSAVPATAGKPPAKKPPSKVVPPPTPLTPKEEEQRSAGDASTMHKWMTAYSLDHGGMYPQDLSALLDAGVGFPVDKTAEYLRRVIEYRGRKLTNSDDGRLVLMRYRIEGVPDKEVRLYVTGRVQVHLSTDPIPEDLIENSPEEPR
jgi:hypothetical protein